MTHVPVMCQEVLSLLPLVEGATIIDGTFGAGGYTQAMLERADLKVIGIDRDPEAVKRGQEMERKFGGRFFMNAGPFSQMKSFIQKHDIEKVDGIVLDLGVSSAQLDQPERGFSFQKDGPLDMRMSQEGLTAAQVVACLPEEELARILWEYGEERKARRIARKIASVRQSTVIDRTETLAALVRSVTGPNYQGIDPATRTFMALRIYVNEELEELKRALRQSEEVLKDGGRIVIVTFHSLEDRLVKHFFKQSVLPSSCSRYRPDGGEKKPVHWSILTKKPIAPGQEELALNPRSRSAKLRAAQWSQEMRN